MYKLKQVGRREYTSEVDKVLLSLCTTRVHSLQAVYKQINRAFTNLVNGLSTLCKHKLYEWLTNLHTALIRAKYLDLFYHTVGRKKRQHVDDTAVVQYMLMNGSPPRASTKIEGYWFNVARGVSGILKPTLRFTKAVSKKLNWYCNRSGIQDAYHAASCEVCIESVMAYKKIMTQTSTKMISYKSKEYRDGTGLQNTHTRWQ